MKNYSAIVCASFLAVALGACGGGDAPADENAILEPVEGDVASEAVDVTEPSDGESADGEAAAARQTPFDTTALVTSPINGKVRSLPSLTPSASVTTRVNSTSSGKSDPFSGRVIPVRAIPPETEDVSAVFPRAGTGTSPASDAGNLIGGNGEAVGIGGSGGGSSAIAPDTGAGGRAVGTAGFDVGSGSAGQGAGAGSGAVGSGAAGSGAAGGSGSIASGDSGDLPDLAARPPIPDPALARGVEVTGVVLIGSSYQAIVKAPDEPTSRYVSAGQRLSGGRVLVKRIENQGSEPVVVLEEDGVEVIRSIGAPPEGSASGDVAALLPELEPAS